MILINIIMNVTDTVINECSICYVNKVELSLLCKHSLCNSCYRNVEFCPFCRKRIKPKRRQITIPESPDSPDSPDSPESIIIVNNDSQNQYCVLCIILFAPFIWFLFLLSAIINIQ